MERINADCLLFLFLLDRFAFARAADDAQVLVRDAVKMVEHKGQAAVRKGKDEGEWLTGGVKGLPFPGMSVEMAKRMNLPEVVEVVE